jgi:HSP20 family protein
MDELFGDVLQRSGLATRKRAGFSPAVDVSYAQDPPRAIVTAELAGIDTDELDIEIQGRELVLSGQRRAADPEGRLYQQVEIEHGPFRRVVQLGAEVRAEEAKAVYEDGLLRIELPLAQAELTRHSVPVEVREPGETSELG